MTSGATIPRPLRKGDVVGVAAVSGHVNASNLGRGVGFLEGLGLKVRLSHNVHQQKDYFAGSDEDRVEGLNELIADSSVRGIFFARGGYGSMRILTRINYNAIRNDPKIMIGMSDLTALSMAIYQHCGMVTLAGPMLAGQISEGLDENSVTSLIQALMEPLQHYQMIREVATSSIKRLRHGKTRGILLGGCLSLLASLLGTPHCPNFADCVLFIEDLNEPPYKIDRMLTQMKLAGIFENVRGVIICQFSGDGSEAVTSVVESIVLEYVEAYSIPVISNYPHGHTLPNITLPVGALVEFEVSANVELLRVAQN